MADEPRNVRATVQWVMQVLVAAIMALFGLVVNNLDSNVTTLTSNVSIMQQEVGRLTGVLSVANMTDRYTGAQATADFNTVRKQIIEEHARIHGKIDGLENRVERNESWIVRNMKKLGFDE